MRSERGARRVEGEILRKTKHDFIRTLTLMQRPSSTASSPAELSLFLAGINKMKIRQIQLSWRYLFKTDSFLCPLTRQPFQVS